MDDMSMLSIKQFAKMTGTSESTLRYYDKLGLFTPAARGRNNYRFYSPYQMIVLNFIKVLTELGVPLTRIKSLTKNRDPKGVLRLLMERGRILDNELQKLYASYSVIHAFEQNIHAALLVDEAEISINRVDEIRVTLGPDCSFYDDTHFYSAFVDFCETMTDIGGNLNYPSGGCYDDMDTFIKNPSRPSRFFLFEPHGRHKVAQGNYLSAYIRGYYGNMGDAAQRLTAYANEHNLKFNGPVYVLYLLDEISVVNRDEYLARVSVRVMRK